MAPGTGQPCHAPAFAGLRKIPEPLSAARIRGEELGVFRHIQLPKLRRALIAILSPMETSHHRAYVVTRGGPGLHDVLSHELVQCARPVRSRGGAMSVIYFFIVVAVSWVFFVVRRRQAKQCTAKEPFRHPFLNASALMTPVWLITMLQDQQEIAGNWLFRRPTLQRARSSLAIGLVPGYVNALIYLHERHIAVTVATRLYAFSRHDFFGHRQLFSSRVPDDAP